MQRVDFHLVSSVPRGWELAYPRDLGATGGLWERGRGPGLAFSRANEPRLGAPVRPRRAVDTRAPSAPAEGWPGSWAAALGLGRPALRERAWSLDSGRAPKGGCKYPSAPPSRCSWWFSCLWTLCHSPGSSPPSAPAVCLNAKNSSHSDRKEVEVESQMGGTSHPRCPGKWKVPSTTSFPPGDPGANFPITVLLSFHPVKWSFPCWAVTNNC